MFDSKTTLTERLTDAADLLLDFATLGEYGLEPAPQHGPACEARRRRRSPRSAVRGDAAAKRFAVRP